MKSIRRNNKYLLSLMIVLLLAMLMGCRSKPGLPLIFEPNQTFLMQSQSGLTFVIDLQGSTSIEITGHQITTSDYSMHTTSIMISASYLNALSQGLYTFQLVTSTGNAEFNILVEAVGLGPVIVTFDSNVYTKGLSDVITMEFDFKGATFVSLKRDQTLLSTNQFSLVGQTIVFNSNFLNGLSFGTHAFLLTTQYGEVPFNIIIKDQTGIQVDPSSKENVLDVADINQHLIITGDFNSLEATLVLAGHGITENDYTIDDNAIIINQEYLETLLVDIYTYVIENPSGNDDSFVVIINGKPMEAPHPDGQTITKFTNEFISNEPLRVQAVLGSIKNIILLNNTEITSDVGHLSINSATKQFTFVRNNTWWGIVTFTYKVVDSFDFESDPITMTIEYKPLHPTIFDKDLKEYFKATADAPQASIVYTIGDMQGLNFSHVTGQGITSHDYTFSDNLLTIKSSYLMTLDYGKHIFMFYTTGGMETFLINVRDAFKPDILDDEVVITISAEMELFVEVQHFGNDLLSIKHQGIALLLDVDYQIDSNQYVFLKHDWIDSLSFGNHELVFENAYGSTSLYLLIRDDLDPTISFKTSNYFINSNETVEVVLNLFGNTLYKVTGNNITENDYQIVLNSIIFENSFLDALDDDIYTFIIKTRYTSFEGEVSVQITINFVAEEAEVISVHTTYDADEPTEMIYTVDLNDYTFLDVIGLGIHSYNYNFVGGTLTIKASFLRYFFEPDTYTLTLRTKHGSNILTTDITFDVIRDNHQNRVINEGFETGDLYGWNAYAIWKDESGLSAFRNERVVSTSFYGTTNIHPYNKDGYYHFGVYAHPYNNDNKDLNQERMGMLRSSDFVLGGSGWISFKLGGGQNPGTAYVSVRMTDSDIEIARFANRHFGNTTLSGTSNAEAYLFQYYFNLSNYLNESLYFLIVDGASREWNVLSFDSFLTYHETKPTTTANTLAQNITPVIYNASTSTNSILNPLSSNINFWEDPNNIFQWQDGRARTNKTYGDGCVGVVRSPAFHIDHAANTHLKWEWEGDIRSDKQLFILIREVGTNNEVLRLTRRSDQSTKTGGGMITHWYDLSSLDSNKAYYIELVDNNKGPWGLMSIRNVQLVPSHDSELLSYRKAENAYFGLSLVNIINGRHRTPLFDFSYVATTAIYYVMSSIGADPLTQINFNYHSYFEGSYFIYTKASDPDFKNATVIYPTCEIFDLDGFVSTYQCNVYLTDLDPNESYIYTIQGVVNQTKTYQFKTLGETGTLNIALFADTQFETLTQALIHNQLLDILFAYEENISFGMIAGDIVEQGGNQSQWDRIFEVRGYRDDLMVSAVPGNHDYYKNDGNLIGNQYFNRFFNNPNNGEAPYQNSSYYIIVNDTLFMMLDTVGELTHNQPQNSYGQSQIDWFKSVIVNNPTTFVVVMMHYSPYGDYHRTTNQNILNIWGEVFDEMRVDVVLSGHDHLYTRTHHMYDQAIASSPEDGTLYLSVGSAGHKLRTIQNDQLDNYAFYQTISQSVIVLMSIDQTTITFTTINLNGDIIDTFSIGAKTKTE